MKKILSLVAAMLMASFAEAQFFPDNYSFTVTGTYYNGSVYANGANIQISMPSAKAPLSISAYGEIFGGSSIVADNSFYNVSSYTASNSFSMTVYRYSGSMSLIPRVTMNIADSNGTKYTVIIHQNPYCPGGFPCN